MATDATGTPTSPDNIPTYNVNVDKPSGAGFNAAMTAIQTALDGHADKPASIASGEVPVWNGSGWVRSSVTNVGPTSLGSGTPDNVKVLHGDGTWGAQEVAYNNLSATVGPTGVTVTTSGGDLLVSLPSATYLATKYYFELWIASLVASVAGPNHHYFALYDGAVNQSGWMGVSNVTATAAGPWFFKVPFTPTAGTKALSVKWGSNGGGHSLTINAVAGGAGTVHARVVRA